MPQSKKPNEKKPKKFRFAEELKQPLFEDLSEKEGALGLGSGNYQILEIHLSTIKMEEQIRQNYDDDSINELAQSIKSQGLINPIEVVKEKDHYRIISGHRRYLAFKRLGYEKIPAIIKQGVKKDDIPIRQLIENIQREDLDPIDEALAMKKILEIKGITQEELAKILGKSKSKISKTLSILKLLEKVSHAKLRGLPAETLYELTAIEDEETLNKALDLVRNEGISRIKLREILKGIKESEARKKRKRKEITQVLNEIYSGIDSLNQKVLKFKIKYGKELEPEDEEKIRKQIERKMKELLKIVSTIFEGRGTIDVQVTFSSSMDELPFPGTSTIVKISNSLVKVNYSFIDYSASKEKIIETIAQKLPKIQRDILENSTREDLLNYWNALPFMKISQNVDGFFFKALKEKYKLPRRYLELKGEAMDSLQKEEAQRTAKDKGYTFEE